MQEQLELLGFNAQLSCPSEVALRLAISEGLEIYAPEEVMAETPEMKEVLEEQFPGHEDGKSLLQMDAGAQALLKAKMKSAILDVALQKQQAREANGAALGPRFVRMTFHDAADIENMIA